MPTNETPLPGLPPEADSAEGRTPPRADPQPTLEALQRASLLARTGHAVEAAAVVQAVRDSLAQQEPDELVYFWLWLTEGIVSYYDVRTPHRIDRLVRAHALAQHLGREDLAQLAAAHAAAIALVPRDYDGVARWLRLSGVADAGQPLRADALNRVALVASVLCLDADALESGIAWAEQAQRDATMQGDRVSRVAALYNNASMRLARVWLRVMAEDQPLPPPDPPEPLAPLAAEFEAVMALGEGADAHVFDLETLILRARLAMLQGEPAKAEALLQQWLAQEPARSRLELDATVWPMLAWLAAQRGDRAAAAAAVDRALSEGRLDTMCDDEAVGALRLLVEAAKACDRAGAVAHLPALRAEALAKTEAHRQQAAQVVQALGLQRQRQR